MSKSSQEGAEASVEPFSQDSAKASTPDSTKSPPSSLRQIRKDENKSYLYMVIFTLVVVGSVLIGLIYGWGALLTGVPCLLGGALMILLPWWALTLIEKWRDNME